MKEYDSFFKDYYFYFNEFDLFDRKNTKIINKFINPHKKYYSSENINTNENMYWEKEKEDENNNNNKSNTFTYNDFNSTGTISNVEQHGDYFVLKKRIFSYKKPKIILDKDKSMDKEFKELLNEENDTDNLIVNSNNKKINNINNSKLKEKMRKYMNINKSG